MAPIDYNAVLADLEARKIQIEAAIGGIKAMMLTPQARPTVQSAISAPTSEQKTPRGGFFGRDPSQPTIADRAAAVMPQDFAEIHIGIIRERIQKGGKDVTDGTLRDILTRKDKVGRFRKHGRGMFSLNPNFSSNNGHLPLK